MFQIFSFQHTSLKQQTQIQNLKISKMKNENLLLEYEITERKLSNEVITSIIKRNNYNLVNFDSLQLELSLKRAVIVIISSYLYEKQTNSSQNHQNNCNNCNNLILITDMRGNIAHLYLPNQIFQIIKQQNEEGTILILLQPIITKDITKEYLIKFQINNQQDILIVGKYKNFSRCKSFRKDGKKCNMPIDVSISEYCKYHINAPITSIPPPPPPSHSNSNSNSILNAFNVKSKESKQSKEQSLSSSSSSTMDPFLSALLAAPKQTRSLESISKKTPSTSILCDFLDDNNDDNNDNNDCNSNNNNNNQNETFSQKINFICSKKDGSVIVPSQSTVFSKALNTKATSLNQSSKSIQSSLSSSSLPGSSLPSSNSSGTTNSILRASINQQNQQRNLLQRSSLNSNSLEKRWNIGTREQERALKQKNLKNDTYISIGNGGEHSVILSMNSLLENSKQVGNKRNRNGETIDNLSSSSSSSNNKMISKNEIDSLLNRQSINEINARDEWTDAFVTRLKTLEKKEEKIINDEEITSIQIRAAHCQNCNKYTEQPLSLCQKQGHIIHMVSTKKRFIECQGCGRRDYVIGNRINEITHNCSFCGQLNWKECGKNRSGFVVSGSKLDKNSDAKERGLITTLSAETSRKDKDTLTALHSSLDLTTK